MTGQEQNLVVARIPIDKLRKFIDRFLKLEQYENKPVPDVINIRIVGKHLMLRKDGFGTITLEVDPEEDDPIDALPEFVTQQLSEDTVLSLFDYISDRINLLNNNKKHKPFTGASFNF